MLSEIQNNKKTNLLALLSVCLFVITGFFAINSWLIFMLPIVTIFYVYDYKHKSEYQKQFTFSFLDYFLYAICLVEIVCCITSIYKPNSISFTLKILLLGVFYYFIQTFLCFSSQLMIINKLIALLSGLLSLITICWFYIHRDIMIDSGFQDLTNYRLFFQPFGVISNDWSSILICLLPFSIVSAMEENKRFYSLFVFTGLFNTIAILICLSRGAILSVILFFIVSLIITFVYHKIKIKKLISIYSLILLGALIFTFPIKNSLVTTFAMNKTVSQQRSINGRFQNWKESIDLFKLHPITGVGSGNYALASDSYSLKKQDSFSFRSTNTFLQILVERGMLGFIIYVELFIYIIYNSLRKINEVNWYSVIFLTAIISILFRDMTFSTFFERDMILVLFILILTNLNKQKDEMEYEIFGASKQSSNS